MSTAKSPKLSVAPPVSTDYYVLTVYFFLTRGKVLPDECSQLTKTGTCGLLIFGEHGFFLYTTLGMKVLFI
jgi:hypothetical protein